LVISLLPSNLKRKIMKKLYTLIALAVVLAVNSNINTMFRRASKSTLEAARQGRLQAGKLFYGQSYQPTKPTFLKKASDAARTRWDSSLGVGRSARDRRDRVIGSVQQATGRISTTAQKARKIAPYVAAGGAVKFALGTGLAVNKAQKDKLREEIKRLSKTKENYIRSILFQYPEIPSVRAADQPPVPNKNQSKKRQQELVIANKKYEEERAVENFLLANGMAQLTALLNQGEIEPLKAAELIREFDEKYNLISRFGKYEETEIAAKDFIAALSGDIQASLEFFNLLKNQFSKEPLFARNARKTALRNLLQQFPARVKSSPMRAVLGYLYLPQKEKVTTQQPISSE